MSCNLGGVHKPLKIGVLYAKKTCWGTNDSLCLWWNLLPLTLILCFGILATFFGAPKRMTRGVDKQMLGAAQISLKSYSTKKTRGSSTSHVFFKHIFRPIVVNVARCAARSIGPLGSWRGSPISTWWRLGEVLPGTIFICTKKKTMCSQSAAWKQIKFPICSWTAFGFFHWPV